jgi:CheY-like chemotaxis protein
VPKPTVLVVDDDLDVLDLVQLALENLHGWTVLTADGGPAAIELCRAHQPDVVLLDIMMPTMDGLQAYEHLQADPTTRDIPVILFTAKGRAGMWRSGDAGIRGLIPKPYDPMGLGDQIIEILGWQGADWDAAP